MKITPTHSKSTPVYPTLMAMVGAVLAGCDEQPAPGSVPYEEPGKEQAPQEQSTEPDAKSEAPFRLGGVMIRMPDEE